MVKAKRRKRKLSKPTSTDDDVMDKIEHALETHGKLTLYQMDMLIKSAIWVTDDTPVGPYNDEEW